MDPYQPVSQEASILNLDKGGLEVCEYCTCWGFLRSSASSDESDLAQVRYAIPTPYKQYILTFVCLWLHAQLFSVQAWEHAWTWTWEMATAPETEQYGTALQNSY